jgi:hypothetical protein
MVAWSAGNAIINHSSDHGFLIVQLTDTFVALLAVFEFIAGFHCQRKGGMAIFGVWWNQKNWKWHHQAMGHYQIILDDPHTLWSEH